MVDAPKADDVKPATQSQIRAEALLAELMADGKLGADIRKAAKAKFPDIRTVDEVAEPVVAPLRAENEALRARLDKLEESRAADRKYWDEQTAKQTIDAALEQARKNYNLTDEGLDKAVARVKEMGAQGDMAAAVDAAAAWVASKTPPAQVKGPTWAPQDLNLFGSKDKDDALVKLHRDPVGYQDDVLSDFFRDPDRFVRESQGA
jgi:hypothetical protein